MIDRLAPENDRLRRVLLLEQDAGPSVQSTYRHRAVRAHR
jgi:hypothetical protein